MDKSKLCPGKDISKIKRLNCGNIFRVYLLKWYRKINSTYGSHCSVCKAGKQFQSSVKEKANVMWINFIHGTTKDIIKLARLELHGENIRLELRQMLPFVFPR